MTDSINKAVTESERRRHKQLEYNQNHNITPKSVVRKIDDGIIYGTSTESVGYLAAAESSAAYGSPAGKGKSRKTSSKKATIQDLEKEMAEAAKKLDFERAAILRDKIAELRSLNGS
jgi:excinuclease ABC subunit B